MRGQFSGGVKLESWESTRRDAFTSTGSTNSLPMKLLLEDGSEFEGLAFGCGRHIPVRLRPSAAGKPPFTWVIG